MIYYCCRHTCSAIFSVDKEREWSWSSTRMTEDSNSELRTSSTFSCHIQVRIIANSDRFYERGSEIKALFYTYIHNFRLTTLGLSCVINTDCSTKYSDQNIRNVTLQDRVGEEILIWDLFTTIIIIDENSVHLGDISSIELYEMSTDWYIIIVCRWN